MSGMFVYLAMAACLATLGVLVIGIGGFGTGKASASFSQRMMRWRIALQFVAIIFIMLTVTALRNGN